MTEPAPRAPGLGELFEQSLTAAFDPSVFRRAALRPPPSFGSVAGLALASGGAALAIGLAHAFVATPGFLRPFSPPVVAAVAVAGVGLYSSLLLLLAVALYGVGNGAGGKGEFERGLQAAAMISALAPLQMMCGWFPAAWPVPALLAAWVAAGSLEGLFNANRGPVRAVCALLAAGAIGLQFVGRTFVDRTRDAYSAAQAVQESAAANAELARSVSALAQQAGDASGAAVFPQGPVSAAPATSGLDLLRGGPAEGDEASSPQTSPLAAPATQAAPPPGIDAAARAMQTSAAGMLDALTPMINMLTTSKSLRPEQQADIKELQGLMRELKTDMASNKKMDNAVFQDKMRRYQSLLMRVMAYSSQAAPAAGGAAKAAPPHLQLPKEDAR